MNPILKVTVILLEVSIIAAVIYIFTASESPNRWMMSLLIGALSVMLLKDMIEFRKRAAEKEL